MQTSAPNARRPIAQTQYCSALTSPETATMIITASTTNKILATTAKSSEERMTSVSTDTCVRLDSAKRKDVPPALRIAIVLTVSGAIMATAILRSASDYSMRLLIR